MEKENGAAYAAIEAETERLAKQIYMHAPYDGVFSQPMPELFVSRHSKICVDTVKTIYSPCLLVAAQGKKEIAIGQEVHQLEKSHIIMLPIPLPGEFKLVQASLQEPYLCVGLNLNPQKISGLLLNLYPHGLTSPRQRNDYVAKADFDIINALNRLLACFSNPGDAQFIAPLIMEEILIRALRGPLGMRIMETGFADSPVVKVIAWLHENFSQQVKVSKLAEMIHMSEASFYKRFKAVASMSPVQYQKALRLHEARRLMASRSIGAAEAGYLVGYASETQFSRDYSRFFGSPPKRDAKLRQYSDGIIMPAKHVYRIRQEID